MYVIIAFISSSIKYIIKTFPPCSLPLSALVSVASHKLFMKGV